MNHHFHLGGREIEQPAGLDHLEAFVHQGGGIDRDAVAHLPCWMIQGLLRRHRCQRRARAYCGTGRRRQSGSASRPAARLPARRHWWAPLCSLSTGISSAPCSRTASITRLPPETRTSLFARPTRFPQADRFVGSLQAGHADDRRNHGIDLGGGTASTRAASPQRKFRPFGSRQTGVGQTARSDVSSPSEVATTASFGRNSRIWAASSSMLWPATRAVHLIQVAIAPDHVEGVGADRAREPRTAMFSSEHLSF